MVRDPTTTAPQPRHSTGKRGRNGPAFTHHTTSPPGRDFLLLRRVEGHTLRGFAARGVHWTKDGGQGRPIASGLRHLPPYRNGTGGLKPRKMAEPP